MSDWWYVIAIVVIAALAIAYLLYQRANASGGGDVDNSGPARDYTEERETNRVGGMSDEDREWEAGSQRKNREAQERDQSPPTGS